MRDTVELSSTERITVIIAPEEPRMTLELEPTDRTTVVIDSAEEIVTG